jgi:uncharacterized membrane protein
MAFLTRTRLSSLWESLRSSFWFLPTAMAAAAVGLAVGLIRADVWLGLDAGPDPDALYAVGPEGARAILSVIASSMITVAGLTFSITMLTLQLATSQFGPRLMRNFMRDRSNQFVLGTFIAAFVYCILVLRAVRGTEDSGFVPHLAVSFGVILAVAGVAVLIHFIHHIAASIRIENLLAELAIETSRTIDAMYPERIDRKPAQGCQGAKATMPSDFEATSGAIFLDESGYVQSIDTDALMRTAIEKDVVLRIEAHPGQFVTEHSAVITAYPLDRISNQLTDEVRGAIIVGVERTPEQDLSFSIRRIVEIAQRALSPGTNDPTTALYCIDRLGEALGRVARRRVQASIRLDKDERPRIVTNVTTLADLACPAFAAIARYGVADADLIAHLLNEMNELHRIAAASERTAIGTLRDAIHRQSLSQSLIAFDRDAIEHAFFGKA